MSEVINIQEPTLISFVERIQDLVKQGYVVSKTNQGVPQSFGFGVWVCQMVPEVAEKAPEKTSESVSDSPKQSPKEDEKTSQEASQESSESSTSNTEGNSTKKPSTRSRRGRKPASKS